MFGWSGAATAESGGHTLDLSTGVWTDVVLRGAGGGAAAGLFSASGCTAGADGHMFVFGGAEMSGRMHGDVLRVGVVRGK